ncbi:(2Fe-2S)-binding protein [Rhodococcus sp. O3]|uniref:(2Fe-2S)-binding protein n=1 Tax=Rhodococcus sp. O3 TaxID=3404919 RepID=UPI003B67A2A4
MTDGDWLAARVADTGARWSCNDPRVNGTLWWYSASSTLVAAPIFMLSTERRAPDPHLDQLECTLRDDGYLGAVRSHRLEHDARSFAAGLVVAYGSVIDALAAVSGAAHRALWAIVTDSVASHALAAGRTLGKIDEACALAVELAVPPLPTPRFVDIESSSRTDRFVRRASCCLIHLRAGNDKCTSCPRRDPTDRHARLLRRIDGS